MKKFITLAVAAFTAALSLAASAAGQPDNLAGFATSEACLRAVQSGTAKSYVPVTSRAPGSAYARMSIAEAGYSAGACVQGLTTFTPGTWVYLPANFQVGRNGEHLVMWQCGNAISSIAAVPVRQAVTLAPPVTSFSSIPAVCTDSAERCVMKEWCDNNDGWKVIEGVRTCEVPGRHDRIIQRDTLDIERQLVVNPRTLPTTVNPWQGSGDFTVPPPPQARGVVQAPVGPAVDFNRSSAPTVRGLSCGGGVCVLPQSQAPARPAAQNGIANSVYTGRAIRNFSGSCRCTYTVPDTQEKVAFPDVSTPKECQSVTESWARSNGLAYLGQKLK